LCPGTRKIGERLATNIIKDLRDDLVDLDEEES
jgi:hypothetical protein